MTRRGPNEVVVNKNGGYWVRSKTGDRNTRRQSTRDEPRRQSHQDEEDLTDMIVVEDAEHGRRVYQAPPNRPRATRERSYSASELPPRRRSPKPERRRREPVIIDRAASPPRRRREPSASSEGSDRPPPQRREKSPRRRRRVSFDDEPPRKSEVRAQRAVAAPPPPPPYQPVVYAQPGPAQPYYGQGVMEPQRRDGNIATRFGKKLGNAAIFGVGFTGGADLVNSIF